MYWYIYLYMHVYFAWAVKVPDCDHRFAFIAYVKSRFVILLPLPVIIAPLFSCMHVCMYIWIYMLVCLHIYDDDVGKNLSHNRLSQSVSWSLAGLRFHFVFKFKFHNKLHKINRDFLCGHRASSIEHWALSIGAMKCDNWTRVMYQSRAPDHDRDQVKVACRWHTAFAWQPEPQSKAEACTQLVINGICLFHFACGTHFLPHLVKEFVLGSRRLSGRWSFVEACSSSVRTVTPFT